jgi:predicted phage terminase large subunit-like protein
MAGRCATAKIHAPHFEPRYGIQHQDDRRLFRDPRAWPIRLEYPQLKIAAVQLASSGGISAVLIEDKASGQSLVQDMRQTTSLPVLPIKVDADKVTRAYVVVPTLEAGRIFAPADATWLHVFLTELASFPKGSHDDIVDAFTQGINFLMMRRSQPTRWIYSDHMDR